ncbi:hypothetical protein L218DRAFT_1081873 [Marasmius fiardii PR-910]|nr:hypothetical protein L218DRAFT_1081873 [Marasmius fiardii PR-910]
MAETPAPPAVADPVAASPDSGRAETPPNAKRLSDIEDKVVEGNGKDEGDGDKECPRLNLLEDVGKGIIKTTDGKKELTILLVGETGVGKTALLSFIGNVLAGHKVDRYVDMHEPSIEMGGPQSQSQTDAATLYEFKSQNGVAVRVLDTPGLADTRGVAVDDRHKTSIAEAIQDHVAVVNAVLILANGTQPRLGVATDYALTSLTSIFPHTLVGNIGFIFTNVPNPLACNFTQEALPAKLRNARQFLLDNPVAVWRKYQQLEGKKKTKALFATVEQAESKAVEVLAELVNWIDQCPPQPTKDIISLYEQSQDIERNILDAFAQLRHTAEKKRELEELKKELERANSDVDAFKKLGIMMSKKRYMRKPQFDQLTDICLAPDCHSNCSQIVLHPSTFGDVVYMFLNELARDHAENCSACRHNGAQHLLSRDIWHQVEEDVLVMDHETQKMFDKAKNEKGEKEASKGLAEKEIHKAAKEIEAAIAQIASAAEAYSKLALSGSFSTQIVKSIQIMKYNIEALKQKGDSDAAEIQKLKESVTSMEIKLKILEEATNEKREQENFISRSIDFVGSQVTRLFT